MAKYKNNFQRRLHGDYNFTHSDSWKKHQKRYNKFIKFNESTSMAQDGGGFKTIFGVLMMFAIFMSLYQILVNPNISSFNLESFLNALRDTPKLDIKWLTERSAGITDDWNVFNWFRNFLNGIWSILSFFLYISQGFVQLFIFLGHFLYKFFGFTNVTT